MTLLLWIAIALFGGIVVWQLEWAVVVLLFLLPSYVWRFSVFGFPSTFLEAMLVLTLIGWGVRWIRGRVHFPMDVVRPLLVPIVGFSLAAVVSISLTADPLEAFGQFKAYLVEPLLFFFVACDVARNPLWRKRIVWALLCSGSVIGALAVLQFATGWGIPSEWAAFPGRRAVAIYPFPNAVGLFLAPILMMSLGSVFFPDAQFGLGRRWSLLASVLMSLALLAAVVEGAVVGVLAGTAFLLWFTRWRWRVFVVGIALLALLVALPVSRNYLLPLLTFQDVSGDVRLVLWQGTGRLLSDRPLLGAGFAGFQQMYDQYRLAKHTELLLYPHNIFLNFWVELGLLGLVSVVGMIVQFFRAAWSLWKQRGVFDAVILMGVMVATLVYGLIEVPFFKNDLAVLWWVMFDLLFALQTKTTQAKTARVV